MNIEERVKKIDQELEQINEELDRLRERKDELLATKNSLIEQKVEQEAQALATSQDWESSVNFPWSAKVSEILSSTFKLSQFRPLQLSAINATLSGNDVMVIMPTGGGKSLCYQLPALADPNAGFTLVVSPLVSLMEDQVMALKKINVQAEMLNANTDKSEVTRILNEMINAKSSLKLLYVTPEKLAKSKRFMAKLQKSYSLGLFQRLAIDEVHCCSVWGHDFRPDYKFLGVVRNVCPKVPIIGLTATSTSQVTEDVKKILNIKTALLFKSKLNRPNLFYEVRPKPENHEACLDYLQDLLENEFSGQSGIIYTLTIKDVESLTKDLRSRNVKVGCYHANLETNYRSSVHKKWLNGTYQAVIATIAFGMGIDKPNVRFVIHHCMSKSMENFYQESGRAGRDGQPAKCILLYKFNDISRLSTMVFTEQTGLEKLYGIIAYCLNSKSCRRRIISDHFGEAWESSQCQKMCDNCISAHQRPEKVDVSAVAEAAVLVLVKAQAADTKVTALKLIDSLMGKGPSKPWKKPPENLAQKAQIEAIVANLIIGGQLREDFHFTPYNTISYVLPGSVDVRKPLMLNLPHIKANKGTKRKKPANEVIVLSETEDIC